LWDIVLKGLVIMPRHHDKPIVQSVKFLNERKVLVVIV
jgi:hypothetical protein